MRDLAFLQAGSGSEMKLSLDERECWQLEERQLEVELMKDETQLWESTVEVEDCQSRRVALHISVRRNIRGRAQVSFSRTF